MNPHDRIDHKILSLARLPVPTLPHIQFCSFPEHKKYNITLRKPCQLFFKIYQKDAAIGSHQPQERNQPVQQISHIQLILHASTCPICIYDILPAQLLKSVNMARVNRHISQFPFSVFFYIITVHCNIVIIRTASIVSPIGDTAVCSDRQLNPLIRSISF